jgi:hypothetical protein
MSFGLLSATDFAISDGASYENEASCPLLNTAKDHAQIGASTYVATGTWDWLGVLGSAATMVVPGVRMAHKSQA